MLSCAFFAQCIQNHNYCLQIGKKLIKNFLQSETILKSHKLGQQTEQIHSKVTLTVNLTVEIKSRFDLDS